MHQQEVREAAAAAAFSWLQVSSNPRYWSGKSCLRALRVGGGFAFATSFRIVA
jgi:hypothetical protein